MIYSLFYYFPYICEIFPYVKENQWKYRIFTSLQYQLELIYYQKLKLKYIYIKIIT